MTLEQEKVIGQLSPDRWSILLQTGYQRFNSPLGIDGLAIVHDTELELLAIVASQPGKGHFRRFIQECQKVFPTIIIMDILNDWLAGKLADYGFKPFIRTEWNGEQNPGMRWIAKRKD